jgi:hypothetical protein
MPPPGIEPGRPYEIGERAHRRVTERPQVLRDPRSMAACLD